LPAAIDAAVEVFLGDEQLLLAGAALLDVDCGEHAAIRHLALEDA